MSDKTQYYVYIGTNLDILDSHYTDQVKALARANYLYNSGKYSTVRVAKCRNDGPKITILEKRYANIERSLLLRDITKSHVCQSWLDTYSIDSRIAISHMLRSYFDQRHIIASELLHDSVLLRSLYANDKIKQEASERIARAQITETGKDIRTQTDFIMSIFSNVLKAAENLDPLEEKYRTFTRPNLTQFIDEVSVAFDGEEHDRVLTYLLSKEMIGLKGWEQKLVRVCSFYDENQSHQASSFLDESMAEILSSPSAVKSMIGLSTDLGAALTALSRTHHGLLREKECQTESLKLINTVIQAHKPERTRAALSTIISKSLLSPTPLSKRGIEEDRTIFKTIVSTLQGQKIFVGDREMCRALTIRAKSLFGSSHRDLPTDVAVNIVSELLGNNEQRFDYIMGLLSSEDAADGASIFVENLVDLLKSLKAEEVLALKARLLSGGVSQSDIVRKLAESGVPATLADKIFTYFTPAEVECQETRTVSLEDSQERSGSDVSVPTDASREPTAAGIRRITVVSRWDKREWSLGNVGEMVMVGRAESCDIQIHDDNISRVHGYFMVTSDGFGFVDQSTNGSYLVCKGTVRKIHKSALALVGKGVLSFAKDPIKQPPDRRFIVSYEIS